MSAAFLEFRNAGISSGGRRRKHWLLRALDAAVPAGAVVGVAGAGKTLFLKLASAQRLPDEGEVLIDGHPSHRLSPSLATGIVWLAEGTPVWPHLTLREALELQAGLHARPRPDEASIDATLETLGFEECANWRCERLSTGQKVRLQLATLFVTEPRLAVIDAAVLAVDEALAETLWKRIDVLRRRGTAFVLAAAEPRWAARCDKLLWLPEGRELDATQVSDLRARVMQMKVAGAREALELAARIGARIAGGEPGAVRFIAAASEAAMPGGAGAAPLTPTLGDALVLQSGGEEAAAASATLPAKNEECLKLAGVTLLQRDGKNSASVDLHCRQGEIVALLGRDRHESLRLLAEGRRPVAGEVAVLGRRRLIFSLRKQVGYLPPDVSSMRDHSARLWLEWVAAVLGVPGRTANERIARWGKRFGIEERLDAPWAQLSYGEKRLAQCLAVFLHEPRLLLLDAPFAGLTPERTAALRALMLEHIAQGAGIVYAATHRGETWFADTVLELQAEDAVSPRIAARAG